MSNPISETNDNNVIENIIQQINSEGQNNNNNNNNNNELQIDPNNTPKPPTFDLNQSNKIMNFINNFKSSIIVGIIIILFSFPQINKFGKVILKVNIISKLQYSYVFPYLLNGVIGGVLYYYISNLNI